MQVQPYLNFDGRCEEALEFYRKALGAEVIDVMRMKDNPEPPPQGIASGMADKILHASFRIDETTLMASDGHCMGKGNFEGIALALTVPNDEKAKQMFAGLTDGGNVLAPLAKTFFSSQFGMVTDRFGIMWMILVAS